MTYKTMYQRMDVKSYRDVQRIRFLGDIHLSSRNCDEDMLRGVADEWRNDNKNAAYVLMGDVNDFASYSERAILAGGLHESTQITLDDMAAEQIDKFVEMFDFIIGKTIFVIEGNHKWQFVTKYPGLTSDQVLAARLGATWGGALCHCALSWNFKDRNTRLTTTLAAHHGKAGGKRIGAAFNQIEDMAAVLDADIYAMGHNHRADSLHGFERLYLKEYRGGDRVAEDIGNTAKAPLFVRTGSFLKAYPSGQASYVVSRILPPSALGAMEVEIKFKRSTKGGKDRMIQQTQGRIVR
jgi:UDP-2,3-diacylglucosamine pyrophosphatase LpxH